MSTTSRSQQLFLELGDIIRINAPDNSNIDNHVFLIDYLDDNQIDIIDDTTLDRHNIGIKDGKLSDETIQAIEILSKPEEKGYARQHGLVPNTNISIQFGGELPITINGTISALEEDMIEITTYPDDKKLYIDFGYKGIPKNLPIESIRPFTLPKKPSPIAELTVEEGEEIPQQADASTPVADVRERLREVLFDADQIVFGETLGEITQFVPVSEQERRYGLETQANDLLDDLLSTIPSADRTRRVLNGIHVMIERFKQLREKYSLISKGEIQGPAIKGPLYKPLVDRIFELNKKLYWLLPIVRNRKKLYDIEVDVEDDTSDIVSLTLGATQKEIYNLVQQYTQDTVPDGENKYQALYRGLNPYLTPFEQTLNDNDIVAIKQVEANLTTVVDNLADFYSSVICKDRLSRRRFVIEEYNLGLSQLRSRNLRGSRLDALRVPLTVSDSTALRGFLTLPEPVVLYSHVNLPTSTILTRSHLNLVPFNYWSLLSKSTQVASQEEEEGAKQKNKGGGLESEFSEIQAALFKQRVNYGDRDMDRTYKDFLEKIVPETSQLFRLLRHSVEVKTSYVDIVKALEPFLVYPDDINFPQYRGISLFIDQQILALRREFVENDIANRRFIQRQHGEGRSQWALLTSSAVREAITRYDIPATTSQAEFIRKIKIVDGGRLLVSALSVSDIDLFQPVDIEKMIRETLQITSEQEVEAEEKNPCKPLVLAKYYIDLDDVKEDNGNADVFFDRKYDPTRYEIADEFGAQKQTLGGDEYLDFLAVHLEEGAGLTPAQAKREAQAIAIGKRRIISGEYAYTLDERNEYRYFVRDDQNQWIPDESLDGKGVDEVTFCNLQNKCLEIKGSCGNMDINEKKIKEQLLREIVAQFDDEFHLSVAELRQRLLASFEYNQANIGRLLRVEANEALAYDIIRRRIGDTLGQRDVAVSPYAVLRDRILSQVDFVERQANLRLFIEQTCRKYNSKTPDENQHWYYGVKTGRPLLPTFYGRLADAYLIGKYSETLEKVVVERGEISDDGEKVVDKYSGYVIRNIEYNTDEGYDEAGYKLVTRDVLERDIQDIIKTASDTIVPKLESEDARMIANVVSTLDRNLGISINSELEFIVSRVIKTLERILRAAKKRGRKRQSYQDAHDDALLLLTFGYYIVTVQTMMPSVRTHRTFPGCVRSFVGYPLQGEGDLSTLKYIVCTALKLRSSARPWVRLPFSGRAKALEVASRYVNKLKKFMDDAILVDPSIKDRLEKKVEYLLEEPPVENIPPHFDVKLWLTFLPPLTPVNVTGIRNITTSFKGTLLGYVKEGNSRQFPHLTTLFSRMFYFSLHIIELIQRIVNEKAPLLTNIANEPLVENACCNEGTKNTLLYFTEKDPDILKYNDTVVTQQELYDSIVNLVRAAYIFDPLDTKLKYPKVSDQFSETTIYLAFIQFCSYNSGVNIPENLKSLCGTNESAFKKNDTIDEKIRIMKSERINYTREGFERLLNIVNRENIVDFPGDPVIMTARRILKETITDLQEQDNPAICDPEILKALESVLDTFDINVRDDDKLVDQVAGTLENANVEMRERIVEFFRGSGSSPEVDSFLREIDNWDLRGEGIYLSREDETAVTIYSVIRTFVDDIIRVYPSIIANEVSYKKGKVPAHWKVSQKHMGDIQSIINTEISPLYHYYGDADLAQILLHVQGRSTDLLRLIDSTPFFANIVFQNNIHKTVLNGTILKLLSKYYFLCALTMYLEALDADLEVVGDVGRTPSLTSFGDAAPEETRDSIEAQIIKGRKASMKEKVSQLIQTYISILSKRKKTLNVSNEEIKDHILKARESEKTKVTKRLGDLTVEEREVQNILKNHRLGEWSLGQTRALFEYNPEQYEIERSEIEQDTLAALRLGKVDGVTERNRDIYRLEYLEDQVAEEQQAQETFDAFRAQPDDDDFGERDSDAQFD